MNRNINNYSKKEINNKLKNFREGSDYSVFQEGEKKIFNFHNSFLRDIFGNDYTTIYEVAENWDSDNFNHHREAAEYENDKTHITYRYEHKINKDKSGYRKWSWGGNFGDEKHTWALRSWPNPNFDNNFLAPVDEAENHRRNLEQFRNEREMLERDIENLRLHEGNDYEAKQKIRKFAERINDINEKIRYHEDWLAKNDNVSHRPDWINCPVCDKTFDKHAQVWGVQDEVGFQPTCCYGCAENFQGKEGGRVIKRGSDEYFRRDPQQKGWTGRDTKGSWITGEASESECRNCGFKEISPSDKYCMECGVFLCDKTKSGKTDLAKENKELKSQLVEVQKQLAEILEELKKLRNNSTVQNNAELDQQIDYNEKIIRNVKEVPEAEIKEQVQKSEALLKGAVGNTTVSPDKGKGNGAGSLPYIIGGSIILASVGIIGYLFVKKNKRK